MTNSDFLILLEQLQLANHFYKESVIIITKPFHSVRDYFGVNSDAPTGSGLYVYDLDVLNVTFVPDAVYLGDEFTLSYFKF